MTLVGQKSKKVAYASVMIVALGMSAVSIAKYESQVAYLQALRAPLSPTAESCQALTEKFQAASTQISRAHDGCLSSSRDTASGSTCTKASCQALHSLLAFAQKRTAAEGSLCRQRLAAIEVEADLARAKREQDLRAAQERLAQERQRQEQLGAGISRRVEGAWNNPITQSTLENEKNAVGAAVEGGVHDVVPGLRGNAIGSAGSAGATVGGVLIGVGIGALDPEVATGVKAILDRRGGRHPADKIIEEDDAQFRPPVKSGCDVLSDPTAKKRLADSDLQRLVHLIYSCSK